MENTVFIKSNAVTFQTSGSETGNGMVGGVEAAPEPKWTPITDQKGAQWASDRTCHRARAAPHMAGLKAVCQLLSPSRQSPAVFG